MRFEKCGSTVFVWFFHPSFDCGKVSRNQFRGRSTLKHNPTFDMSYDFSLLELNYCIILHVLETRASSASSLKAFFADVMNLQVRERTREKIGQTSQKPKGCKLIRGQLLKWWVSPKNPWVFLLQKDQHLGWRLGVPPYPVGTAWIKFQELRGCAKRMKNNTGLQRWAPRIETNWQGIWLMKWEMYNSIIYIYIWVNYNNS